MSGQANSNTGISDEMFVPTQTFPQISITNLTFVTDGGTPYVNADIEFFANEDGIKLTVASSVKADDTVSIAELKQKLLEEFHQVIAETAAFKLEDYSLFLAEGLISYNDRFARSAE